MVLIIRPGMSKKRKAKPIETIIETKPEVIVGDGVLTNLNLPLPPVPTVTKPKKRIRNNIKIIL